MDRPTMPTCTLEPERSSQRSVLDLEQEIADLRAENEALRKTQQRNQNRDVSDLGPLNLQALVDSLPYDYVLVRNDQGKDEYVNLAWSQLLLLEDATPRIKTELDALFHRARQECKSVSGEILMGGSSDSTSTVSWKVKIFPVFFNVATVAMCALINVEEKVADAASLESDTVSEQETMLFRHFPVAYCKVEVIFDSEGKAVDYSFLGTNASFEALTGIRSAVGKRVTQVLPGIENDPADWIGRAGKAVRENYVDRFEKFSQPLGRWYSGVSYRVHGNVVDTFFLDHSEYFSMQRAIQESEERHNTLFENMKQGVVYHDSTGAAIVANASAQRILGLSMDQLLGKTPMDPQWRFVRDDGSVLPVEEYPAVVALQGKPVTNLKMGVFNTIERQFRWAVVDAMPRFREGEDSPYQAYTIFTDMTEEREMQANLVRAKEMAEEADQLKSAFLATMSHEIRTPLNGIMGHIELILSNDLSEEFREENMEGLQVAMDCGKLLMSIIQDILDLSKIEAGQLDIVQRPLSIHALVSETMKLANAYRLQRKKDLIELVEIVDTEVAPYISGDFCRIQQVLNNLLSNAIKFTDDGSVTLEIELLENKEMLQFSVSDTGKGIEKDRLDIIFQPFRQVEIGDSRKHGGTGLGLTICKKLVELMGGTLQVQSVSGTEEHGSRFSFTLPYKDAICPQQTLLPKATVRPAQNVTGRRTVLLADDDSISRRIARKMLEKTGFRVIEACDGAEAVSLFREHRDAIDLILLDVMMPIMSGLEATEQIRSIEASDPTVPPIPIVALSAGAMKGDREKGLEAGMSDYLCKPVSQAPLEETIRRCLGQAAS